MRFWIVAIALLLAGCETTLSLLQESEPDYKKIVANYVRGAVKDPGALRDISISKARFVTSMSGHVWSTCLKADLKDNLTGQFGGFQTYIIFIENDKITDRRRAMPEDNCESESFEPLKF